MLISVCQKTKFTVGDKEFITPTDQKGFALVGVPFEAPDWIVQDPYFGLLYNHAEAPVRIGEHPSGDQAHPSGANALLTVYGEQPSISVSGYNPAKTIDAAFEPVTDDKTAVETKADPKTKADK